MSEFWKRKMRTYFYVFDYNKDGYISENDFAEMGRSFAKTYRADADKQEELGKVFANLWWKFTKTADLEKDSRVTLKVFIESVEQQRFDPGFTMAVVALIQGMFELLDVNKDGFLQPQEHKAIFDYIGVPEDRFDRRVGFDSLDINHDGVISMQEFVNGALDFWFSEDESCSRKNYFGPLVD